MFFSPFAIIYFFIFLFILFFLFALVQIGFITVAFAKIGLTPGQAFGFLLVSLIGSHVNIPIKHLPGERMHEPDTVRFFGVTYNIPGRRTSGSTIAINLGGAVVPVFLSAYLLIKQHLFLEPVLGILVITIISYWLAKPVPKVGIALPLFIPPLFSALIAVMLSSGTHAPVVAYISGVIGTLIGADILHLKDVRDLDAPVVSIGGAGTFDGIFLTGIIAVLLA
ncbi:MAG: DUF1614 domain-containing protein [Desulfobacteraceae bacterium]|nr:DUF1614 domain-containing protein [Desulfobacteraceae bacterium]